MHIGLVIYGSLATVSGGYLYDRRLVAHLRQQGDQVDIISLPWRNYTRHVGDNVSADLRHHLAAGYDLLLQDELNHPSLFWANRRLSGRVPVVTIVHHLRSSEQHPGWASALYRSIERSYLQTVAAAVYNSATTSHAVAELLGRQIPHVIAYPGGDRFGPALPAEAVERRAGTRPLRLLFVGNLIPRKGLHTLLAALARLPERVSWHLTIVGSMQVDPDYARRIYQLVAHYGLDRYIVWRGGLTDAELAAAMEAAHCLVVPSTYEGFGIVYLEGMGHGLPAIATTAGAAGEIITDGKNGYLVPPEDAATLAARLELLAGDRRLLLRMSRAALARYAAHPVWDESMATIRDFLLTLTPQGA